jgi:glycogen(starch) synthase
MRVLIVASLFAPWRLGGAEVVAESSALALTELGHEVQVLTLSPDQETSQDHQDGYEIRRIPLVNIYPLQDMGRATTLQRVQWHIKDRWNSAMQNVFTSELKKIQPDVVLLHNIAGFSICDL